MIKRIILLFGIFATLNDYPQLNSYLFSISFIWSYKVFLHKNVVFCRNGHAFTSIWHFWGTVPSKNLENLQDYSSFWTGLRRCARIFHPSGQDYVAALRFPFPYHGLSYRPKQKHVLRPQDFFFRAPLSLTRASSRRSSTIRKKHSTFVECF